MSENSIIEGLKAGMQENLTLAGEIRGIIKRLNDRRGHTSTEYDKLTEEINLDIQQVKNRFAVLNEIDNTLKAKETKLRDLRNRLLN